MTENELSKGSRDLGFEDGGGEVRKDPFWQCEGIYSVSLSQQVICSRLQDRENVWVILKEDLVEATD